MDPFLGMHPMNPLTCGGIVGLLAICEVPDTVANDIMAKFITPHSALAFTMVQALAEAVNATAIGDADGPVVQAFRDRMQAWITDHATPVCSMTEILD